MRIKYFVFLYALTVYFANPSFAEITEINKFLFSENPNPIDSLKVLDKHNNEINIFNKDHNILLINFWATWCSPCTKEMPSLSEFQSKFDKDQLKVITIATGRNNPKKILEFFKKYELSNLENYRDPKGILALELGVIGLPYSIIISKNKTDMGRLIGPIDWSKKEVVDLFLHLINKNK